MSNGGQGVFTFDLYESLWFKKGQEVKEIMGISLEPEISIHDYDDFVSIRGVIELKGEYFQVNKDEVEEDQVVSFNDQSSQRFVDRVESYEDGINEFFHHFPVEVSIPKYRIDELDDVMVGIESFDYEIPEQSQLKLSATIAIHGVQDEGQQELREEEPDDDLVNSDIDLEEELIEKPPELPSKETFEFDIKEKEELDKKEPMKSAESIKDVNFGKEKEVAFEKEEKTAKAPEKDRWKYKKSQSFAEFFGKEEEPKEESVEEYNEEEEIINMEESSEFEESVINYSAYGKDEFPDDEIESPREEEIKQDPTYLLNIFDHKEEEEEEERYSSLKMCIVQDDDTLDSIAERYEISAYQISQSNKLMDDELSVGQILYIPVKS
ncbi:stage VI sporulation protein D [Aquibacillus albus]|uniref:Stage VI sporulation protein D n=1 Tax=Aquibacillus albus TaxID=1168171 RepID=A0ABS2N1N5_9BACI|nr:stage VI sporulation protein D [Aquibacillus albus]MBM7572011.1 stage VI sporulation protein D [Aquibacillus albus]